MSSIVKDEQKLQWKLVWNLPILNTETENSDRNTEISNSSIFFIFVIYLSHVIYILQLFMCIINALLLEFRL